MSYHRIEASQELKTDIERLWNFFSSPKNLISLTPPEMKLKLISSSSEIIANNTLIELSVNPFCFINLRWRTIIRDVQPLQSFKDIQLNGPYQTWEHTHTLKSTPNGVLVSDNVIYSLPGSKAGDWLNKILVRNKLTELFEFRKSVLDRLFN